MTFRPCSISLFILLLVSEDVHIILAATSPDPVVASDSSSSSDQTLQKFELKTNFFKEFLQLSEQLFPFSFNR